MDVRYSPIATYLLYINGCCDFETNTDPTSEKLQIRSEVYGESGEAVMAVMSVMSMICLTSVMTSEALISVIHMILL